MGGRRLRGRGVREMVFCSLFPSYGFGHFSPSLGITVKQKQDAFVFESFHGTGPRKSLKSFPPAAGHFSGPKKGTRLNWFIPSIAPSSLPIAGLSQSNLVTIRFPLIFQNP